jgi:hypothetical protein
LWSGAAQNSDDAARPPAETTKEMDLAQGQPRRLFLFSGNFSGKEVSTVVTSYFFVSATGKPQKLFLFGRLSELP